MKGTFLLFLLVFIILNSPGIEAQEMYQLDLETAIQQAVAYNRELDLIRREEALIQEKITRGQQAFHVTFSSDPQLTIQGGEVFPTFSPQLKITAEKGILGGTLSSQLTTWVDLLQDGQVEALIAVSYRLPLIKNKEEEEVKLIKEKREQLVEEVIHAYYNLLLKEEKIQLQEEELALAALKLQAARFLKTEEGEEQAQERVVEQEKALQIEREAILDLQLTFQRLLHLKEGAAFILVEGIQQIEEPKDLSYWLKEAQKNNPHIIQAQERLLHSAPRKGSFMDEGWEVDLMTGIEPHQISPWPSEPSFFIRLNASRSFTMRDSLEKREEELRLDKAALELEKTTERITRDVTRIYQRLLEILDELQALKKEEKELQRDFSLLQSKYSLGLIGPIALEEGRIHLHRQHYNLLSTLQAAQLQYLELQKICGQSIVPEDVMKP